MMAERSDPGDGRDGMAGSGDPGPATAKDPLSAYCTNLTARARQGVLDPLIGRADELQRTIEVLCRRRKNNPVFVGDAGVGKTAMAEGLAMRLLSDDVQDTLKDAEIFALDTGALLAGSRFRGDFEERFKAVVKALSVRPKAILFIDEIHATVGAGAVTGGTMDLATMLKPLLTAGDLRVIGSTTFEEFKHIEKDRALARRLQKIAIDEPSIEETVRILAGLRSRYEDHHRVKYTDAALESRGQAGGAAPARLSPARQRHRSHRRSGRRDAVEGGALSSANDARSITCRRVRHRADRRADGAHSRAPGVVFRSRAAARCWKSRSSASSSARRKPCIWLRRPSSARARGWRCPNARPAASCSPVRRASARPSSPSSWRCCSATSSSAST